MGGFFYVGEKKERPDNYHRITNTGSVAASGAQEGIGAAVVTGNWGAIGKAVTVTSSDDFKKYVGEGSGYNTLKQLFDGGVNTAVVVRVGTGGTVGTVTLKDTTASTAKGAVKITGKYPGTFALAVSVKASLSDDSIKEVNILHGTTVLENYKIAAGTGEVKALVAALADSSYVKAEEQSGSNGTLAEIAQASMDGGADPSVTTASYGDGFTALEPEVWNSICVDSNDAAVHALLQAYIDRIYESGSYPLATVSEPHSVALETRMTHAQAFDDEKMHYVLNGWVDSDGTEIEGYLAAARVAGMIGAIASNDSLTHKSISRAVSLIEPLTNSQIIKALKMGCVVISTSKATQQVRIEKGINTKTTLAANMDAGWKKIRRTKTRFELMSRIDATIDQLNGNVNNDEDGRSAIMAAGQSVLDAMIGEKKLLTGAEFIEDPSNPAYGDSAWFLINADDIDSFEIGYLTYGFRFSQPTEE